jgi:prepilin-type N-terminal cleavage/methylation domain-containing protein
MRKQSGFSVIEIVIGVAVLAIIGFLGYSFYTNSQKSGQDSASQSSVSSSTETIESTADLDKAATTMDDINIDSENDASLTEIDKELAEF